MLFKKLWLLGLVFCALVPILVSSLGDGVFAQDKRLETLVAEAKKEGGKLVLYTTMNMNDSQNMMDKFSEKYPFVKGEIFRSGGTNILLRVEGETKAKQYKADIIEMAELEFYVAVENGLIGKYLSPEREFFSEDKKDSEGLWTIYYVSPLAIAYNTNLLSAKEAPAKLEDLVKPQWKGKIGGDNSDFAWFAAMLSAFGEEKGMALMRGLAANVQTYFEGHSLGNQLLAAGQFPVALNSYVYNVEQMKEKGAPVEWVGYNPLFEKMFPMGLYRYAPHPNTAKLFIDFVLSKEGQEFLVKTTGRPAGRKGVKGITPRLNEYKYVHLGVAAGKRINEYTNKFREVFVKK